MGGGAGGACFSATLAGVGSILSIACGVFGWSWRGGGNGGTSAGFSGMAGSATMTVITDGAAGVAGTCPCHAVMAA